VAGEGLLLGDAATAPDTGPTATWVAMRAPLKALPTPPVMPPITPLKATIRG